MKKGIAFLLALAMSVPLIGCSSDGGTSSGSGEGNSQAASQTGDESSASGDKIVLDVVTMTGYGNGLEANKEFMKKYTAIGKALKTATTAYDDAERKLQPSGQSILQTCAKLQKLGAKQSDKNPLPQLIDIDEVAALAPPADDQDDN